MIEGRGFNPISANLMRGASVGRMAFVPEGQADSSQARSAWVAMQRDPRPGGTVEVIVSPTRESKRYWPWPNYFLAFRVLKHVFATFLSLNDSGHFVPGYYQCCPSGTKYIRPPRLRLSWRLCGLKLRAESCSPSGARDIAMCLLSCEIFRLESLPHKCRLGEAPIPLKIRADDR